MGRGPGYRTFHAERPRRGSGVARRVRRTVAAAQLLASDNDIPRPLRWGGALGAAPLPGPLDEVVLLVVIGVIWLFYRDRLSDAWHQAGAETDSSAA